MPKLSLHSKATVVFTSAEEVDTSRLGTTLACAQTRWGSEATLPLAPAARTTTRYLWGRAGAGGQTETRGRSEAGKAAAGTQFVGMDTAPSDFRLTREGGGDAW